MSLHDSALSNSHLQKLAISFVYKVPNAPAYASDLVLRTGTHPRVTGTAAPLKACLCAPEGLDLLLSFLPCDSRFPYGQSPCSVCFKVAEKN